MRIVAVVAVLVSFGCSSKRQSTSGGSSEVVASADPCAPAALGLSGAVALSPMGTPEGCTVNATKEPVIHEPRGTWLDCSASGTRADVNHRALVVERMLSPAQIGTDVYDDGKTITFVNRQRATCPGDPQAMPVPVTLVFRVETDGTRAFAEASCTVPRKC
jgi:hypothetical protein